MVSTCTVKAKIFSIETLQGNSLKHEISYPKIMGLIYIQYDDLVSWSVDNGAVM